MGSTPSGFILCPQQSFIFFTFPTPLCAQFIDLPLWSSPGDGHSPWSLLSSSILTLSCVSPSPGSTCLQNRSPRSLWGGCTLVRPRPTTCGRKANPTQTRGEEQRHLQVVLSSQGLWMSQSPALGGWQVHHWPSLSVWRKRDVCCGHRDGCPCSMRGCGQGRGDVLSPL